jgi:hypothetical protein
LIKGAVVHEFSPMEEDAGTPDKGITRTVPQGQTLSSQ